MFDLGGILLGWLVAAAGLRCWTAAVESWLGKIITRRLFFP